MLFNKYQYKTSELSRRGYSQSVVAYTEENKQYWVKWILGIDKTDIKAKILADKLRHLQKARHDALPNIIDYGFDEELQTFAIVYELLEEVQTFENKIFELNVQGALSGLIDLSDCLFELYSKYKIHHGDIHPSNILIDKNGQFYLIDFGLADITRTLSQTQDLEIFARNFAAPEKINKLASKGFPFQSDIYSLGKVVEWFFDEKQLNIGEEGVAQLIRLLSETPADRPSWQQVIEILKKFAVTSEIECVQVRVKNGPEEYILELLNSCQPIYNVSPKEGANYLVDILLGDIICQGVIWLKEEDKLLFNGFQDQLLFDAKLRDKIKRDGKKLPFNFFYSSNYSNNKADLTPYFQKWFELKQKQSSLRENRKVVKEELGFYKELLEKEKEVIAMNSLRLNYTNYNVQDDEIHFQIEINEKTSSIGHLMRHIEEGNDVQSEGFEYMLSAKSDRKQSKESVEFVGKPYEYDSKTGQLRIKDVERLNTLGIPRSGYLFEKTNVKEEEKNRQLDAIRKVDKNEVQNPDLIYYLFRPDALPLSDPDFTELEKVWQHDKNNQALKYSYNQQKAIQNALTKSPLSVIQGPPGTGKTTVITEIVFQLLAKHPEAKILITSQTNNAVDQVLENLVKNEIPILRLSGISAPKLASIKKHTLDRKMEGWKMQVKEAAVKNFQKELTQFKGELSNKNPFAVSILDIILAHNDWKTAKAKIENNLSRIKNLETLHNLSAVKEEAISTIEKVLGVELFPILNLYELHHYWIGTISSLDEKSAINQKLIDSIRVIGATCNHIASKKYSRYNFEFDYVIMDESGKATTAEALVPITMGKNLIFVGDHRQLKPMLTSTREVEKWLRNKFIAESTELENWEDYFNRPSLFEQVITSIGFDYKAQLTECRRSSFDQVNLTSKCFYEPEGDEPIEPIARPKDAEHNLPFAIESSVFFIDIGSDYKNETENNKSSLNKVSAEIIANVLEELNVYEQVKDYSIGVITGYTAQCRELKKHIDKRIQKTGLKNIRTWNKKEEKLSISVVDRFQGLERDIVIVDLVKSGPGLQLGFLEVPNRINVALSRQKKLLIVVGDYFGIINAKTSKRLNHEKAALQKYLEVMKPTWIVKADQLKGLFIK